jgi:hypothetical protein
MDFLDVMQRRIASVSVGPSTARRMGPAGTISAARTFLGELDLRRFNRSSEADFLEALNRSTHKLIKELPREAQYWGAARKYLNIFLRNVIYNKYLCQAYGLGHIEPWLEIPLDSHVAKGLQCEDRDHVLPKWKAIITVDRVTNGSYQDFAFEVAKQKGINRIHLDLIYWRRETIQRRRVKKQAPRPNRKVALI